MIHKRSVHGQHIDPPVSWFDHTRGSPHAPVTLAEYGDYGCPFSAEAHGIVNAIRAASGTDLLFVYRHFPITSDRPDADVLSEAAEAAGAQGHFWRMHDWIYEHQSTTTMDDLRDTATWLGLDVARFAAELAARVHLSRVREDLMSGVRSGVVGTPAFFINGIRYDGDWSLPALLTAVRAGDAAA